MSLCSRKSFETFKAGGPPSFRNTCYAAPSVTLLQRGAKSTFSLWLFLFLHNTLLRQTFWLIWVCLIGHLFSVQHQKRLYARATPRNLQEKKKAEVRHMVIRRCSFYLKWKNTHWMRRCLATLISTVSSQSHRLPAECSHGWRETGAGNGKAVFNG